jgi:Segregation and condensation protein ScpA
VSDNTLALAVAEVPPPAGDRRAGVGAGVHGEPQVIDNVAVARLYGEPLFAMPTDLYIPPDALEVFLEAFEGPLDLLLYLIRKQNFNILDIPLASVTRQYLTYVDQIRKTNLELASEYLLMAAMLIEIKSRMLLPPKKVAEGEEAEDPRADETRRGAARCAARDRARFPARAGSDRTVPGAAFPGCGCGRSAHGLGRNHAARQAQPTPHHHA